MPAERFFIDASLQEGTFAEIATEEFHHLAHVSRCKEGDEVELVNGKGTLAKGVISSLGRSTASIEVLSSATLPKSEISLTLAQGIPRANRLEMILEKGVELGVTSFLLVPTKKSEKKPSSLRRMEYILISALKQSGRLYLPTIELANPISSWSSFEGIALFGDTEKGAPPLIEKIAKRTPTLIAIGPEKGFAKEEVEHMKKIGMEGVCLHENILRTDTAAIASLAIAYAKLAF